MSNVWKLVSKLDEDVLALDLTVIRRTDLISNVNLFCWLWRRCVCLYLDRKFSWASSAKNRSI